MTLPEIQLFFSEEGHSYVKDGIRLPSVTQIMKPMSLMSYDGIPLSTLSAAADRGSRAHEQISNHIKYDILETDEDTAPYVDAFLTFEKLNAAHWLASEYRCCHQIMRYAGTIDLIGFINPDDGHGVDVIDLKCTSTYHTAMLSAQLGAYAEMLKSHGVPVRKLYGLQLLKNGKFHFEEVENGYKLFLHCMAIHNAMNQ